MLASEAREEVVAEIKSYNSDRRATDQVSAQTEKQHTRNADRSLEYSPFLLVQRITYHSTEMSANALRTTARKSQSTRYVP